MKRLEDKVALVTGGSSGIGEATARLFARHGAKVAVLARGTDEVERVAKDISESGGEAMAVAADISKPDQMEKAVREVVSRWERLEILFANAGINGVWAPLEELEPDEWSKTISVNLTGTFLTIRYAAPYLKRQGGSIIITSSINGTRVFSNTGATAYACSKAGQVALAKMLALELADDHVRVNVICPGSISTEIEESTDRQNVERAREPAEYPAGSIPLTDGEPGTSEEVAELVLFLASDASRHITGTPIWIDGAQSLLIG
jgi:NAD(P)-dependent dehydrogenase (short-subunit alcohol dehydrogenase family)